MFLSRIILLSLVIFSGTTPIIHGMNPPANRSRITWHVNEKSGISKRPCRAIKNHQKKYQAVYQQLEKDFLAHKPSSTSASEQKAAQIVEDVGATIKKAIKQENTVFDIIETLSKEIDPIKNSSPNYMVIGQRYFIVDSQAAKSATESLETIYAKAIYNTCLINQKNKQTKSTVPLTPEYSSDESDKF